MMAPPSNHRPLKICMVSSEVVPFAKTGGLADVVGALATEFARLGHDVCVLLPAYRQVDALGYQVVDYARLAVPTAQGLVEARIQERTGPHSHVTGSGPVSYTHLDVYKRQAYIIDARHDSIE